MKTETSKKSKRIRGLLLLPLLVLLLYAFSNKIPVYEKISAEQRVVQDKATPEMIAEYNALAKKYNSQSKDKFHIHGDDVDRLHYLYSLMSREQKAKAEPFPEFPGPPSAPEAMEVEEVIESPEVPDPPNGNEVIEIDEVPQTSGSSDTKPVHAEVVVRENTNTHEEVQIAATVTVHSNRNLDIPHPPQPKAPRTDIRELAAKNARFYYDGDEISADNALELMENNDHINIHVKETNSERPLVHITSGDKNSNKN